MKFVKSNYRGRWVGVVLESNNNRKPDGISMVLLLKDQNGMWFKDRIIKIISNYWLHEVPSFDITNINPDWFKNLPKLPLY